METSGVEHGYRSKVIVLYPHVRMMEYDWVFQGQCNLCCRVQCLLCYMLAGLQIILCCQTELPSCNGIISVCWVQGRSCWLYFSRLAATPRVLSSHGSLPTECQCGEMIYNHRGAFLELSYITWQSFKGSGRVVMGTLYSSPCCLVVPEERAAPPPIPRRVAAK